MGAGLKTLSSKEVIVVLATLGFAVYSQKGSHIKLRRESNGIKEMLMVPDRRQIAKGTLRENFDQASVYVPQSELRSHFYRN